MQTDLASDTAARRAQLRAIIATPPCTLRVVDRFKVTADGRIVEQENHYDPRPALAGS
jgi:hypothetical protein